MSDTIGIGIVGLGYWGPKLIRNFEQTLGFTVVALCDAKEERRAEYSNRSSLPIVASIEELLQFPEIDAVAIATPVGSHYFLAKAVLSADKHVMVEKPFTRTSEQAIELIQLARERKKVLMVDHTFLFTAAAKKLRDLVESGELGDLLYYDSTRVNLGLFQPDVDVIWDLAPHDFSILDHVITERPKAISAIGRSHTPSGFCDVAYITLDYGNSVLAHFHLNWLAPQKIRQVMI